MELNYKSTKLTKVKNITIPGIFRRRLKTGIPRVDSLFDEGLLPGSAMTLTAQAGCGKTTFMLQVLDGLSKNDYNVGYLSGEESIYQLAYTANRVKSENVSIANITDIDEICELMDDLDVIVIDSFQSLTTTSKLNSRQLEKYAVQKMTRRAKDTECVVVFIMHLTKSGDLKGGTIVPHTVDANLKITKLPEGDFDGARAIFFEKNRFGPLNELECTIEKAGYDFEAVVVSDKGEEPVKAPSKKTRKANDIQSIMDIERAIDRTLSNVAKMFNDNVPRARLFLKDLETVGKLTKHGRGKDAYWVKN